jgi:hypothetical protein
MSWVATAVIGGTAIYKGISSNQRKQRNKGYTEGNYQLAKKGLQRRQEGVRQSTSESLAARGLTQGGLSPIQRAMAANSGTYPDRPGVISQNDRVQPTTAVVPHTLGEQQQVDNDEQFRLEQVDLEQQRERAERENKAEYIDALVNAGTSAALQGMQAYGIKQDMKPPAPEPSAGATSLSPIQATMTGVDNPANWFGGVVGTDPLRAPGSSWNRDRTASIDGLRNHQAHV